MNSKVAVILPLLFSVSRILEEADVYRTSSDNNWHILSLLHCLTCLITLQQITQCGASVWTSCVSYVICFDHWKAEEKTHHLSDETRHLIGSYK